jgi:hypothetical protein
LRHLGKLLKHSLLLKKRRAKGGCDLLDLHPHILFGEDRREVYISRIPRQDQRGFPLKERQCVRALSSSSGSGEEVTIVIKGGLPIPNIGERMEIRDNSGPQTPTR